jgi:hypothetical protein
MLSPFSAFATCTIKPKLTREVKMAGYYEVNDRLSFSPQLSVIFPNTGLTIDLKKSVVSRGELYAVIPKAQYQRLKQDQKLVIDKYVLSKAKAKVYAEIFKMKAEDSTIPWILGPASLIPVIGAAITIATSTIDGISRLADSGSVSATQLEVLMADGGAFIKTHSLERHPKHGELLVVMVFYNVVVGTENRMFGIMSLKYAFSVAN